MELDPELLTILAGRNINDDEKAIPCGLIAKSFFNDTFELVSPSGSVIDIDHDDIAWDVDEEKRYD
jgi:hypothetical protein